MVINKDPIPDCLAKNGSCNIESNLWMSKDPKEIDVLPCGKF